VDDLTAGNRLEDVELPLSIAGCQVIEQPGNKEGGRPFGAVYDIQSRGPFGGEHGTLFRAEGDVAEIIGIAKIGRLVGRQRLSVPTEKHVQVLRELGFREMVFPDGKRYEIRNWPGVRRIRES
jgi:hypothetical protein